MKYLRFTFLLFAASCSYLTQAAEITQKQWLTLSYELKTEPRDDNNLPDDPSSAKDIMLVSRVIEELQYKKDFTARQLHQLNKWRRSDATLVVLSDDPDGDPENKIDIRAEAKATFIAIQSRAAADEAYQKWQRNAFTLDDLKDFSGAKGQTVFKSFFNRLPLYLQTGFKDWSVEQLKDTEAELTGDYSAMLSHMANMLGDLELGNYLLQRPVTEHTMSFLDTVPQHYAEQEQLTLFKNALQNSKLNSKSFNLLAQHFAKDTSVAVLVAEALKDRDGYWQALTVVPAFVKAGNTAAFENVLRTLPESQQQQVRMRLKQKH